jgi:hypothetical protein
MRWPSGKEMMTVSVAILPVAKVNRGRCYDHNFLRFLPIFG